VIRFFASTYTKLKSPIIYRAFEPNQSKPNPSPYIYLTHAHD